MSSAEIVANLKGEMLPSLDGNMKLICFILNILPLPGLGSVIAGLQGKKNSLIIVGILEFALSFLFIGWLHSIFIGYKLYSQ
ncbi:hypothetical protein KIPB_007065 [Kipferlia bialata]|uniref:Uncharacterized protein n=1 Tax=Kipferlia bialata TaxID=797122 RepID=A0A391P3K3_9EUKA|nr:hypothetical protein KIPB_007065 [Kipferlia bialata]|eukprot:g7065.t1